MIHDKTDIISMNLAVRITLPYFGEVDCIADRWVNHCDQVIVYEHPGTRLHCHLLLINCTVTTQRLKQLSRRSERGNTFWNFKACDSDLGKYITYMSKGQFDPERCREDEDPKPKYTWKQCEALKKLWVEPAPKAPKKQTTYERYMAFEADVRAKPIEQRCDDTWIRLWARSNLFEHHKMITQQYKNDMANFVETYCFKYKSSLQV